jgi:hypothetical protein
VPPSARPALSAKARITASLLPPAGQGAIKVMGLLGNLSCAQLLEMMAGAANTEADCRTVLLEMSFESVMLLSPENNKQYDESSREADLSPARLVRV